MYLEHTGLESALKSEQSTPITKWRFCKLKYKNLISKNYFIIICLNLLILDTGGISLDDNAFVRVLRRTKEESREVLTRQNGSIIENEAIVRTMTQV